MLRMARTKSRTPMSEPHRWWSSEWDRYVLIQKREARIVSLIILQQFWVNTFQILWKRVSEAKKEAMQRGDSIDVEEVVKATDAQNRQTIASITAVVEIYRDCTEDQQGKVTLSPCPMMVVNWTFRTTPPNAPGRTLWRNIILPDQHQPSLDDDEDEEDMDYEADTQHQGIMGGPVGNTYQPFDWSQQGMPPSMNGYDTEQAMAGTGISFPWAAGDVAARNGVIGGPSMLRNDSGLDLDLGNTFNFDDVPLDAGMMGDLDVQGMDASMLASFDSMPPANSQSAYNMSASSFPPTMHTHHMVPEQGLAHAPVHRAHGTLETQGGYYVRHGEGFGQVHGGYGSSRIHGQPISSMRSTQQSGLNQEQAYRGVSEGGYPPQSQPEQVHTPASLEDGASLTSQRQAEHYASQHRDQRPEPPFLTILPSQREPGRESQPNTASTMSPHGRDFSSQHRPQEFHYHGEGRVRTPQSAAGQPAYPFQADLKRPQQYARVGRPQFAQSHSFYSQPAHEKYDAENVSEATTVAASVSGEQEMPAIYAEEHPPAGQHMAINQPYRFPNGDIQGFQVLRSNDGSQARGASYENHAKSQQHGLGLLFSSDGRSFVDNMGHMKQHETKSDEPAAAGARQLLPSPIDAPLPQAQ